MGNSKQFLRPSCKAVNLGEEVSHYQDPLQEVPSVAFCERGGRRFVCPRCSQHISGQQVIESRCAVREKKEIPLVLNYHGKEYKGLTFDLSREEFSIKMDEVVKGRVAWTRELPE